MAKAATPFLMFQDGNAEEAMEFYVSLFPDSAVVHLTRHEEGMPGPTGKVMMAEFTLAGRSFYCSDSQPVHDFDFTPSISIFVDCSSAAELDAACARLLDGGKALMPADNYGFSQRFAWVQDRYKISWQLNLA